MSGGLGSWPPGAPPPPCLRHYSISTFSLQHKLCTIYRSLCFSAGRIIKTPSWGFESRFHRADKERLRWGRILGEETRGSSLWLNYASGRRDKQSPSCCCQRHAGAHKPLCIIAAHRASLRYPLYTRTTPSAAAAAAQVQADPPLPFTSASSLMLTSLMINHRSENLHSPYNGGSSKPIKQNNEKAKPIRW